MKTMILAGAAFLAMAGNAAAADWNAMMQQAAQMGTQAIAAQPQTQAKTITWNSPEQSQLTTLESQRDAAIRAGKSVKTIQALQKNIDALKPKVAAASTNCANVAPAAGMGAQTLMNPGTVGAAMTVLQAAQSNPQLIQAAIQTVQKNPQIMQSALQMLQNNPELVKAAAGAMMAK